MSNLDLPADVIGHMSAIGNTREPLDVCDSCQRAMLYGGLLYAGAVGSKLEEAQRALAVEGDIKATYRLMLDASEYAKAVILAMLEVVREDFAGACSLADEMNDEEYPLALKSFIEARTAFYVNPETGRVVLEPHDENGQAHGGPEAVAA